MLDTLRDDEQVKDQYQDKILDCFKTSYKTSFIDAIFCGCKSYSSDSPSVDLLAFSSPSVVPSLPSPFMVTIVVVEKWASDVSERWAYVI